MNKKIKGIILLLILIIAITLITVVFYFNNKKEFVYLDFGDTFPKFEVTNYQDEKLKFPPTHKKYKLVFYLDTNCKTCVDQLEIVRRLNYMLEDNNIELNILWKDKIDLTLLNKHYIPLSMNYSLTNKKIDTNTPTIYILDDNNKIIFNTMESEKLMKKIMDLEGISLDKIKEKTNKFFLGEYKKTNKYDTNKSLLVYFTLEGCSDCEKADSVIQNINVQKKHNILKVYNSNISENNGEVIDYGNLFLNLYSIEWYPSFLKIKDNKSIFIGETDIKDLESNLLK